MDIGKEDRTHAAVGGETFAAGTAGAAKLGGFPEGAALGKRKMCAALTTIMRPIRVLRLTCGIATDNHFLNCWNETTSAHKGCVERNAGRKSRQRPKQLIFKVVFNV
ncbi:MAG: hypothetical protein BGO39_22095 [Chloroflexi bacterium 54-19]|nr:MAG: hypothetical protein BGO39_22095 [Chloroflexi bacterium 54-19]